MKPLCPICDSSGEYVAAWVWDESFGTYLAKLDECWLCGSNTYQTLELPTSGESL